MNINIWQEKGSGNFIYFLQFTYDHFEDLIQNYSDDFVPVAHMILPNDNIQIEIEKDWKQ